MATRPYPNPINLSHHTHDDPYRYLQWGVPTTSNPPTPYPPFSPHPQYHPQYFSSERPGDETPVANPDYTHVNALESDFKKLKSNQIQILKELRREYEVLKNTELESGIFSKKLPTESGQSNDQQVQKSRSDVRSSSHSKHDQTKRKSQQKELHLAALEKKQMEVMLNNSMKKIQQLLNSEITLKRTVAQLKTQLENVQTNDHQHQYLLRKHKEEVDAFKRAQQQRRKQHQSLRIKLKEASVSMSTLEGQVSVCHLQLKKKDQRLRILEEEVHQQKNKYCSLQLDLKKCTLQSEMFERSYKEEVSAIERRLITNQQHILTQKNEEIRKLTHQIHLKDERYKLLLDHNNKEQEERQVKHQKQQLEYIKSLQHLVQSLKSQKNKRASHSEQVLSSIMQKLTELHTKPDQQLVAQITSLRRQLQSQQTRSNKANETELLNKIKELQRIIEDENVEKMYFIQDVKKIRSQLMEQRKGKEEAQQQAKQLRHTLRKVEEEARKYSYQLDTIRHLNIDLTESQHQTKSITVKNQQIHLKQLQVTQLKDQLSKIIEQHRLQTHQYEEQYKILKRQLAQEEIRSFKNKEELELRLSLARTQHQAEYARLQEELERLKKNYAVQLNERVGEKVLLQGKLMQKSKEAQRVANQLNSFLKEREAIFQAYRSEYDKKLQSLQEQNATKVNALAQKLQTLVQMSAKYTQVLHRNAMLQQQCIEMKRLIRHNRQLNDGIDHLWLIKEAEYSNLSQILNAIK